MMIVHIHNYAGKGCTKTVEINASPEKYVERVASVGYDGSLFDALEKLYKGEIVTVDQFLISFSYRPD